MSCMDQGLGVYRCSYLITQARTEILDRIKWNCNYEILWWDLMGINGIWMGYSSWFRSLDVLPQSYACFVTSEPLGASSYCAVSDPCRHAEFQPLDFPARRKPWTSTCGWTVNRWTPWPPTPSRPGAQTTRKNHGRAMGFHHGESH